MSADGRSFREVGDKLAAGEEARLKIRRPGEATGTPQGLVLGSIRWPKPGLRSGLRGHGQGGVPPEWWTSNRIIRVAADGADRDPGGRWADDARVLADGVQLLPLLRARRSSSMRRRWSRTTRRTTASWRADLSPEASARPRHLLRQAPLILLTGRARPGPLHQLPRGPEFTDARSRTSSRRVSTRNREGQALDRGWNNIGVRPTMEDPGRRRYGPVRPAALDGARLRSQPPLVTAVDGAFKVPGCATSS